MERLDITGIKGLIDGQKLALKLMGAVEDLSDGEWSNHEM